MKQKLFRLLFTISRLTLAGCLHTPKDNGPVRVAVIGGMMKTGLWPELAARFESKTGRKVELAASGNRELCAEAFRAGQADLITIHSGDITTDLVADGYGINMRPWTRNEFVIVGPANDPAGLRGMKDGALAFEKIAATKSPFVDFQNIGTRELNARLWQKAGLQPRGDWILRDDSQSSEEVMQFAAQKKAYLVLGRIPVLLGILQAEGMEILVQGDPFMRRPFIVMEANPGKITGANARGARQLSDFLLSDETQAFLLRFGTNTAGQMPLFYPVTRP